MGGQHTTVQGHPAYLRVIGIGSWRLPTLPGRADEGRWITVSPNRGSFYASSDGTRSFPWRSDPLTEQRRIGAAVRPTAPQPVRLPFRIGPVPGGLAYPMTSSASVAASTNWPTTLGEVGFAPVGGLPMVRC